MAMRAGQRTQAGEATRTGILAFIEGYWNEHQRGPTLAEIGRACYLTPASVRYEALRMAELGQLVYAPGKVRGIRLTEGA